MQENIIVKGARENNLKNIDVSIPRDKLTVITGLSGSGKSSLAFDTIYAEGQRRYVESLSSYARMFLGQKEKPDVDYIDGLSPAISIDQKTTSQNPRSTVGTVTEIYDYLRLLWARVGTPHCPNCGKEIKQQTIDQIVDQVMALGEDTRIQVMAPVIRGKKGEYAKVFEDARKSGYVRVRVDGSMYDLSEEINLEKNIKHSIEVVVDRLILKPDVVHRLSDSAETAAALLKEETTGGPAGAMVLPDGRVVTGKTGNLLGAASALLMNALKGVSGVDDELYVISDDVLEPICHLKTAHLRSHNPRLHSDETLLALSISSVHNPLAERLIDNVDKLRGCDAYFSVIISAADEKLYRTLGINVCCEPKYEQHRYYHK